MNRIVRSGPDTDNGLQCSIPAPLATTFAAGAGADTALLGDHLLRTASERRASRFGAVSAKPEPYTSFCLRGLRNAQSTCGARPANMTAFSFESIR
jgi:hypothetical protein